MKEYPEFESCLKENSVITRVCKIKNRTFFKIDGHPFSTFGSYVYHKDNPINDCPIIDIMAYNENDPKGIVEVDERNKRMNDEINLFYKHKKMLYKIITIKALELLNEKGDDAFVEYLEHHFFITEQDDNCKKLIKRLEAEK